ncbi:MAG: hypothetical protein HGJ94_13170 [Desulfosarcina sp.]|nr:hypothetical protein [Desulfosarcina sp.]
MRLAGKRIIEKLVDAVLQGSDVSQRVPLDDGHDISSCYFGLTGRHSGGRRGRLKAKDAGLLKWQMEKHGRASASNEKSLSFCRRLSTPTAAFSDHVLIGEPGICPGSMNWRKTDNRLAKALIFW